MTNNNLFSNYKFPQLKFSRTGIVFENWTRKDIMRFSYVCKKLHKKTMRGFIIGQLKKLALERKSDG